MKRTIIFLLVGWTLSFVPAAACSRENSMNAKLKNPADTSSVPSTEASGISHTYLALGDSYTVATSIAASGSYPVQTVQRLLTSGLKFSAPEMIATNGWTTTDLLAALADRKPGRRYDMVTLLIGVNNQYQGGSIADYRDEFARLLDSSIAYAGARPNHVVVLSIPDYGVTPFGAGQGRTSISAEIDSFNAVNKEITLGKGAQYLNITDDTRAAALNNMLLAPDGLHYAAAEYELWAKGLAPLFGNAMRQ